MRKVICGLSGTALTGLAVVLTAMQGQAQIPSSSPPPGPGASPATLQVPWLESGTAPAAAPARTAANPGLAPFAGATAPEGAATFKPIPPYQEPPDPNKDILVSAAQGPWMICVNWYSGDKAHEMARKMVMELRDNPKYHLPAYVFNRGAEERRKEYERVKKIIEDRRQFLVNNNMSPGMPLRVKRMHIEDQCAILVGNYSDADTARRALDKIRKLEPDPARIDLPKIFRGKADENGVIKEGEQAYVMTAFVVHNPLLKIERPAEWAQQDMAMLQKLNRHETYSLLNCKKPYTLMVKQFMLPAVVQSKSAGGKFMESIGLGAKSSGSENAALNAHNMAELFHRIQMTGYVLHTRYASIVTVGAFDGPDDPALRTTQELLKTRLKIPQALPVAVDQVTGRAR